MRRVRRGGLPMFDFLKKKKNAGDEELHLLWQENNFAATEAYKLLRTNVMFTLPDEGRCRIVGITSSMRGEGKSTTAINLAYVMALAGKKVLLIDADLRLPSVSKKLGVSSPKGLSETLIEAEPDLSGVIHMDVAEGFDILTSGAIPPNPSELLGSPHMKRFMEKTSGGYDFIIVDLPPVNVVSDALAISSALDGMMVVVRNNHTKRRELNKCLRALELSGVRTIGVVMNAEGGGKRTYSKNKKYAGGDYYKG